MKTTIEQIDQLAAEYNRRCEMLKQYLSIDTHRVIAYSLKDISAQVYDIAQGDVTLYSRFVSQIN